MEHSTRSINYYCRTDGRVWMEREGYRHKVSSSRTRKGQQQVCVDGEWIELLSSDRVYLSLR